MTRSFNDLFKKSKTTEQEVQNGTLFTDNSPEGYFSKKELIEFMMANQGWPNTHLQIAFDHMKRNGNLSRELNHVTEDGQGATWFNFKHGRVPKTCRISHFGNMKQLLDDYAAGKIKITQTLEELYNEALS